MTEYIPYTMMLLIFACLAVILMKNQNKKFDFELTSHYIYIDTSFGDRVRSVSYSAYCKNTGKTVSGCCYGAHTGLTKEQFTQMLNTTKGVI